MQRQLLMLATVLLAAGNATCASAATVRLGPLPPNFQQQEAVLTAVGAGDLSYFPTLAPTHYGWGGGGVGSCRNTVLLQDVRYLGRTSVRKQETNTVEFSVSCVVNAKAGCGRGSHQTLRSSGVTVYWDGIRAWRCVRTSKHRLAKLSASKSWAGQPTRPPIAQQDLVAVVASAKFERR